MAPKLAFLIFGKFRHYIFLDITLNVDLECFDIFLHKSHVLENSVSQVICKNIQ